MKLFNVLRLSVVSVALCGFVDAVGMDFSRNNDDNDLSSNQALVNLPMGQGLTEELVLRILKEVRGSQEIKEAGVVFGNNASCEISNNFILGISSAKQEQQSRAMKVFAKLVKSMNDAVSSKMPDATESDRLDAKKGMINLLLNCDDLSLLKNIESCLQKKDLSLLHGLNLAILRDVMRGNLSNI